MTSGVGQVPDDGGINDAAPLIAWAKYYLRKGLKPVPKRTGKKYPAVAWQPFTSQSPNEADLDRWFDQDDIDGICLVLDGTGWVVVDCDGPPDRCRQLLSKRGIEIPDACPRVITGRGRNHYYFETNRPFGRHIGFFQDGDLAHGGVSIDLLGQGVVVVPPSRHPQTGEGYRWQPPIHGANGPALPGRVFEMLDTSHPSTSEPVVGPIREGVRERTLMSALGAARRQGAVEPELLALAEAMNTRCDPPLGGHALDRVARSIARYAPEPDDLHLPELLASVPPAGGKAPTADLVFQTPVDLFAERETHLAYVLEPYLIADALTDFTGAAKAGKTRFRNYLISCLVNGESCLGYPACEPSKVVLLSEEHGPALMEGLEAAGLTDTRALHVMTRYAARAADWPVLVAAADAKATAIGAQLLVVDTLPGVARLEGDAENSSGHALAAMRPLQETQTPGLAKLIIRHTRKGGGDLVEKGRGSSAFAGEADVLLSISRPKKSGPTVRRLEALGRFDAIPPVLTVERVTHAIGKSSPPYGSAPPQVRESYRIADAPVTSSIAERLDDILPRTTSEAMTADTLASQLSVSSRAMRDALGQDNQVQSIGAGKNRDPYRYFKDAEVPIPRDFPTSLSNRTTKGGTSMAVHADERGPPMQGTPTVHDETGTLQSPGPQKN